MGRKHGAWGQHPNQSGPWGSSRAGMALCAALNTLPVPKGLGQRGPTQQGTHGSAPLLLGPVRPPDHFCLPRVRAVPHTVPSGSSTHLAGGGRPGTGLHPRRAPRCRSSPPAWSALAGGWCTAERGAEDQASAGWGGKACTGDGGLRSEAGTALLAQLPTKTQRDWGCGLRQ